MTSQAATPRRSKRFQPIIDFAGPSSSTHEAVRWVDEPLYTRTTQAIDLHEEDEIESLDDAQTSLYRTFTRASQEHGLSKKRKSTNDVKAEDVTFRVGDTVLVKSLAKLPSVAVIVSMWEVRTKDEDDEEITLQKVKVHWFLRGSELPTVRARKEKHAQVSVSVLAYTDNWFDSFVRYRTKFSSHFPALQLSHPSLSSTTVASAPKRQLSTIILSRTLQRSRTGPLTFRRTLSTAIWLLTHEEGCTMNSTGKIIVIGRAVLRVIISVMRGL